MERVVIKQNHELNTSFTMEQHVQTFKVYLMCKDLGKNKKVSSATNTPFFNYHKNEDISVHQMEQFSLTRP